MTSMFPVELSQLLDGTTQVLGGFEVLMQTIEHLDDYLVVHTTLKLDMQTGIRWEISDHLIRIREIIKLLVNYAYLSRYIVITNNM